MAPAAVGLCARTHPGRATGPRRRPIDARETHRRGARFIALRPGPPQESFAIVGNPYVRMAHEMCEAMGLRDKPWFLRHLGYSQGHSSLKSISESVFGAGEADAVDMNRTDEEFRANVCAIFRRWLVPALRTAVEFAGRRADASVSFTGHECHLLPQKLFWQHAEWVVEMGSRNRVQDLLRGYGFDGRLAPGCPPPARAPPQPSCRQAVLDCYDEEAAALVEAVDAETFDFFRYSTDWRGLQSSNQTDAAARAPPGGHASRLLTEGIIHRQGDAAPAEDGLAIASPRRRYPILIHAPKTGGTTIENAFMSNYGIVVGMYAFQRRLPEATYPLLPPTCFGTCVDWHMPPASFVHESFVVVRDPYKRIASEMCFAVMMKDNPLYRRFKDLRTRYRALFGADELLDFRDADAEGRGRVCSLTREWMRPMLYDVAAFTRTTEARGSVVPTTLDCHLTPQVAFWRRAEWVIELESMSSALTSLMAGYGYEGFDLKKTEVHASSETAANTEMTSPPGCTQVVLDCLDEDLASLIEVLDAETFSAFGYSKDFRRLQSASVAAAEPDGRRRRSR